jgi:hypothetical protein
MFSRLSSALHRIEGHWSRLYFRWRVHRNVGAEINRRVEVENILLSVYAGKRPMLTREECRDLAYKLGTPANAMKKK